MTFIAKDNSMRMGWWRESGFGMMVHWGLYSALAGEWKGQRMDYIGEWIMSKFQIPLSEYSQLAEHFNPVNFDADKWVTFAKKAGMRYIIYTAKHHEGFAMYHSQCDKYNIVDATPFGKDPLAELAIACKKHDVKLCLYYSQALDWHEPNSGGASAGHTNFGMSWFNDWDFPLPTGEGFNEYFERKVIPQITELLTNYGPIGILWFDTPIDISQEQCERLYKLVQDIQPNCIMNSRLGGGMGDYESLGDNMVPVCKLSGDWETVATMNDTWGYKHFDNNWKTSYEVIQLLTSLAGKGINYVLNIGPTDLGEFPAPSIKVLEEIGSWMETNHASIYPKLASPFPYDLSSGPVTQSKTALYLHLHKQPANNKLHINGLRSKVSRVSLLSNPTVDIPFTQTYEDMVKKHMLCIDMSEYLTQEILPVLMVETEGRVDVDERIIQQGDCSIRLNAGSAQIKENIKRKLDSIDRQERFAPDGVRQKSGERPSLSEIGAMQDWYNTDFCLSWDFELYSPGEYIVRMITSGLHHSNPWEGGHHVHIHVAEQELVFEVTKDEDIINGSTRCYSFAATLCGKIVLPKAGKYNLELIAEKILDNNGVGLALATIEILPVYIV